MNANETVAELAFVFRVDRIIHPSKLFKSMLPRLEVNFELSGAFRLVLNTQIFQNKFEGGSEHIQIGLGLKDDLAGGLDLVHEILEEKHIALIYEVDIIPGSCGVTLIVDYF